MIARMIAGIVLAAGAGNRLGGRPKALLRYRGGLLIEHVVSVLNEAGCSPVYAVLGAADTPPLPGCEKVHNAQWATGMGSSLRAGLAAVPASAAAAVILLVDQPRITPLAVRRVMRAHAQGAIVAMASYGAVRGHPVLFDHSCFTAVAQAAQGDTGARNFIRAHPELVTLVPCQDIADPVDIDMPSDLRLLS